MALGSRETSAAEQKLPSLSYKGKVMNLALIARVLSMRRLRGSSSKRMERCPQACDTEAWDGTTLSCVRIRHVPAELLTPYVLDPARAGVNGNIHGAYRADSISFRGQPLRTGPCEDAGIPMTCAVLNITTGGSSP